MPEPMKLAAIIPARGGSQRIPGKNIVMVGGKPMLAYTIEAAREAAVAQEIIVSTDAENIAQVARDYGAQVLDRPAEFSHNTATTESVLLHALDWLASQGREPETILTLPPTSPLRRASTIRSFVEAFAAQGDRFDAMISLTEDRGDYWLAEGKGQYRRLFPDAPRRSQEREPLYQENSAIYLTTSKALRTTGSILGTRMTGFVISPIEALDVNEPADLVLVEAMLLRTQQASDD